MDIANLEAVTRDRGITMQQQGKGADIAPDQRQGVVGLMRQLWARWKRMARKFGDFQARALMTVFYFVILGPVALLSRGRSDPLALRPGTPRGWLAIAPKDGAPMAHARRQF
jgi:hypothetical protein